MLVIDEFYLPHLSSNQAKFLFLLKSSRIMQQGLLLFRIQGGEPEKNTVCVEYFRVMKVIWLPWHTIEHWGT